MSHRGQNLTPPAQKGERHSHPPLHPVCLPPITKGGPPAVHHRHLGFWPSRPALSVVLHPDGGPRAQQQLVAPDADRALCRAAQLGTGAREGGKVEYHPPRSECTCSAGAGRQMMGGGPSVPRNGCG